MKILITGVHGFVGMNLVDSLKHDHTIYGLDLVSPKRDGIEHTFNWSALDDLEGMELDAVIHLAGIAFDNKKNTDAQHCFDVNMGLTQRIFDFFLASKMKKFIFLSSVKAAADVVEGDVLTEDVVPSPKGPYGESKLAAEKYISSKMEDVRRKDKEVYILRPCVIHGPNSKGDLNMLYDVIRWGIPWPLGSFENQRSFTSIYNLCFVVDGLLKKPVASGVYHVADDETISTNKLIEIVCQSVGKKARIWHVSKGVMERFAKVGNVLHLPLNTKRFTKLTENYVVSNEKIKAALGVTQMPVRAKEGLERTIESFKKAGVKVRV